MTDVTPRFDCHRSGCDRQAMGPAQYRRHIETHLDRDERRREEQFDE